MNDREYLRMYEPVLRFAKSERFFPVDVERYLEVCKVFQRKPLGFDKEVKKDAGPLSNMIREFKGDRYFLRFINDPLKSSQGCITWVSLLLGILGAALGWLIGGSKGAQIAVEIILGFALLFYLNASSIRLRIFTAALVAGLFLWGTLWFTRFVLIFSLASSSALVYLCALPITLLIAITLFLAVVNFIFDYIIPEAPGAILDMVSNATEEVAKQAYEEYKRILQKEAQPVYYGRVVEAKRRGEKWKILQYHFFYAFNDWRFAANGMNHHEGDWEMIAVYLKNDSPHAVLYSQHHDGAMELWKESILSKDSNGNPTTHPLVYVALGSHANYSKADVIQAPKLYQAGLAQTAILFADTFIRAVFKMVDLNSQNRDQARRILRTRARPSMTLVEQRLSENPEAFDQYEVSLPTEYASGDGIRIGLHGDKRFETTEDSAKYLKEERSDREVTHPQSLEWRPVLLLPEPAWVQYQGLWGVKSLPRDESGPPGPRWDRSQNGQPPQPRKRWEKPLKWLDDLEKEAQKR